MGNENSTNWFLVDGEKDLKVEILIYTCGKMINKPTYITTIEIVSLWASLTEPGTSGLEKIAPSGELEFSSRSI